VSDRERLAPATVAAAVHGVRASTAEHLLLMLAPDLPPLEAALLRAALEPLAIERAPARLNAVAAGPAADRQAVEAAARFLEGAGSTTGQLLRVD